jgi:hypothetical protein
MKPDIDRPGDNWLDNLDVIIAGDASLPEEDKDLLHVATRLASALAPLRAMAHRDASDYQRKHPSMRAEHRWVRRPTRIVLSRAWLLVALLALLVCITGISSVIGTATLWNRAVQALHTSTSLDQINGVSIASLARPHAGLKPLPLLPDVLPPNTQATTYGVLTDASDPNIMTTFVADYRINRQDVQLYEQPSDVQFLSTNAQMVQVGTGQGQVFQDEAGNHALQWYQNAMMCQLTSKLPVSQLINLANVFQPIKSWDLLR